MKSAAWVGAVCCVLVAGCSWVKLTPGGDKVRVLEASEVTTCKHIGDSTVSLLSKVAGVNRNEKKVEKELLLLGRNAGADMGGDTVVAASEINGGQQTFAVYKCVGVNAP